MEKKISLRTNPWEGEELPAKELEKEKVEREESQRARYLGVKRCKYFQKDGTMDPLYPVLLQGRVRRELEVDHRIRRKGKKVTVS